jgi:hypothetical protein
MKKKLIIPALASASTMLLLFVITPFFISPSLANPVLSLLPEGTPQTSDPAALTWTQGQPYPIVNGHQTPPPLAVTEGVTGSSKHWYAGGVKSSSTSTTYGYTVEMTLVVPTSAAVSTDFYYVLLSAWDSNGSYIQIGISNDYGVWGLTYSYTWAEKNGTLHYVYNPAATTLNQGWAYHFKMYEPSSQNVYFYVRESYNYGIVWDLVAKTGGNYITLSYTYKGYYDYTNYEEIWTTATARPKASFTLANNAYAPTSNYRSLTYQKFVTFKSSAPSGVTVSCGFNDVVIHNS